MKKRNYKQQGFSLVEVCLALLVVSLGLLAIFGLFPTGLRSSENAAGDTQIGLFADTVLNSMSANASSITDWSVWSDVTPSAFEGAVLPPTFSPAVVWNQINPPPVQFPAGSGSWIRYRLTISPWDGSRIRSATLLAAPGQYGGTNDFMTFYTEFYYGGM